MSISISSSELLTRIELVTSSLPRKCSTTELQQHVMFRGVGAEDGAQTRDPQLGRLVLYRLSYFRVSALGLGGQRWIRTTEGVRQQIYSLPHLATLVFALTIAYGKIPSASLFLEPLQPFWTANRLETAAKVGTIFGTAKYFGNFFIFPAVFPSFFAVA